MDPSRPPSWAGSETSFAFLVINVIHNEISSLLEERSWFRRIISRVTQLLVK